MVSGWRLSVDTDRVRLPLAEELTTMASEPPPVPSVVPEPFHDTVTLVTPPAEIWPLEGDTLPWLTPLIEAFQRSVEPPELDSVRW